MNDDFRKALAKYPQGREIPNNEKTLVKLWKGGNNSSCQLCDRGGRLLNCSYCNLSFHLECFKPPLARVPEVCLDSCSTKRLQGEWACPECAIEIDEKRQEREERIKKELDRRASKSAIDLPKKKKETPPTVLRTKKEIPVSSSRSLPSQVSREVPPEKRKLQSSDVFVLF